MLAPLTFLWNATRGNRLTFWRSPYVRWRVETYSGMPAESLTAIKIIQFAWNERWDLLRYLLWTDTVQREARRHS